MGIARLIYADNINIIQKMGFGLQQDWREVINVLQEIAEKYNRVNKLLSLGNDIKIRRYAVRETLKDVRRVLDLGCGNGVFTEIAYEENPEMEVVMVDILPEMLHHAKQVEKPRTNAVQALFESLPFRRGAFDAVITAFALRDAEDGYKTLEEVDRILHRDGRFIVCDIIKPDNTLLEKLFGFYWLAVSPLLGMVAAGRKGAKVWVIWKTYRRWPKLSSFIEIITSRFPRYELKRRMRFGVFVAVFRKA